MPERIQRRRTKGWLMPEGSVVVSRPGRWGNPFRVVRHAGHSGSWAVVHGSWICTIFNNRRDALLDAVQRYRDAVNLGWGEFPTPEQIRAELAGKDLACWCPLDQPCHADVLLEIANGGDA